MEGTGTYATWKYSWFVIYCSQAKSPSPNPPRNQVTPGILELEWGQKAYNYFSLKINFLCLSNINLRKSMILAETRKDAFRRLLGTSAVVSKPLASAMVFLNK
jgi:hypothetical protein